MEFHITAAALTDVDVIAVHDVHIAHPELVSSVLRGRVMVVREADSGRFVGWLRWNLFWDNTPFLNMLYVLEPYRGRRIGTKLMDAWEKDMQEKGYETVLTSTQSNEHAQHFYQKIGYRVIGGFCMEGDVYELILQKIVAK